jgi:predicted ATPase
MQKIIIKNFGPVKDAEIEIKKVLVLIGEQASGKSTIAKLIYFFKTLRRELAILDFHAMDINLHFSSSTREIFYNFFGSKLISPDFQIIFYYNLENDKYLRLNFDKSKEVCAEFSVNFFDDDFKFKFQSYIKNSQNFNDKDEERDLPFYDSQELIRLLNDIFENTQVNPPLFVIAGRNITVSHSDLFEKYFFADVINRLDQDSIEEQVDDKLIFDFIKKVSLTKDRLKRDRKSVV